MPKYLVIAAEYPCPEIVGGRMRTMNFVRFFQQYGQVDIIHHWPRGDSESECPFTQVFHIPKNISKKETFIAGLVARIKRFTNRRPWMVEAYDASAREAINSIIERENYDVILVRYISSALPLLNLSEYIKKRIVIDFDDVFSDSLYDTYLSYGASLKSRIMREIDLKFLMDYQNRCLSFGAALFCSDTDRSKTGGHTLSKSFVVPNTYPDESLASVDMPDGYGRRFCMLFVGALRYLPNINGLKWFMEHILPEVRKKNVSISFSIVGRNPTEAFVEYCRNVPGVQIHPDVPDVKPYYEKCGIVVAPLLSGGGTRIKILEAALYGRPVVSTKVGSYGLTGALEENVLMFENPQDFIEALTTLDNVDSYRATSSISRQYVIDNYSRVAFNRAMENVLLTVKAGQ